MRHNLGVTTLSHIYGRKWRRGVRTPRHGAAGKKIIRYCLQQLVEANILYKDRKHLAKKDSRRITAEGQKEMNNSAQNLNK